MKQRPMLVIGLDAADNDLIDCGVADGEPPVKSAIRGKILNPRNLEAGSCWPTFGFELELAEMGQIDSARAGRSCVPIGDHD